MHSTVLTAAPRDHGCRAWGGCAPGARCLEHQAAEPVPLVDLYPLVLEHLAPPRRAYGRPRLRLIQGGKR